MGSSLFMPLGGNLTTKAGLSGAIGNTYNQNQALEGSTQNSRLQESGSLFPQYESMLNSGYSPQEQSAISQQSVNGIKSSYDSARAAGANRLARTGNSAGYGSFMGSLAGQEGRDVGSQTQNNQIAFANEKQRRKEAGLQGIAGLYGIDTSFLSSLGNQQLGDLGVANSVQSRSRGVLGSLAGGVGLGTSLVGKGASGGLFA